MSDVELQPGEALVEGAAVERPKAQPIKSRFLFVDVSALRAKQLRRGAKPRLDLAEDEIVAVSAPQPPQVAPVPGAAPVAGTVKIKAERVAMEEVREGLVEWSLPDFKAVFDTR